MTGDFRIQERPNQRLHFVQLVERRGPGARLGLEFMGVLRGGSGDKSWGE